MPEPLPRRTLVGMEQMDLPLETAHDIAMTRFAAFQERVVCWVYTFGLLDWYVDFKLDTEGTDTEAQVEYDRNTRHATFTYFAAANKSYSPDRLALHEVLHLLLGDLIPEDCGDDVAREEHRVIERLLHVLL